MNSRRSHTIQMYRAFKRCDPLGSLFALFYRPHRISYQFSFIQMLLVVESKTKCYTISMGLCTVPLFSGSYLRTLDILRVYLYFIFYCSNFNNLWNMWFYLFEYSVRLRLSSYLSMCIKVMDYFVFSVLFLLCFFPSSAQIYVYFYYLQLRPLVLFFYFYWMLCSK